MGIGPYHQVGPIQLRIQRGSNAVAHRPSSGPSHSGAATPALSSDGRERKRKKKEERAITDTYVLEEYPDDEDREFWARQDGPIRHTLEFQEIGDAVTIALWSEVTALDAAAWESRVELAISYQDVARMRDRLARICQHHKEHRRCDFCFATDPQWVFVVPRDVLSSDSALSGLSGDGRWNACQDCEPHVSGRNVPALVSRFIAALRDSAHPYANNDSGLAEISDLYTDRFETLLAVALDKRPHRP
ncbi:hypothetical protein [Streptomyces sp. SBT349]|uniref:hypothetical protein n=1 Tax=Streptomyces sp. SBT349 TaxID=1580539 RepID=UPI00066A8824|nr:hypothetical protein [Streptomyces sp. SBT349]